MKSMKGLPGSMVWIYPTMSRGTRFSYPVPEVKDWQPDRSILYYCLTSGQSLLFEKMELLKPITESAIGENMLRITWIGFDLFP
jgi:hypothetical protein